MEFLQTLLDNSNIPLLTAFILGLLTAISPCPLATNITAIGYISKDIENRKKIFWNGILYTLGRVITYTTLGIILIGIIKRGSSMFEIQEVISEYGEAILSPALILIGLFMLFGNKINLPSFGFKGVSDGEKFKKRGSLGAVLLGILFALAFCPTSGVFFFGMLIPMSAAESAGYLLPLVFAIATSLPVIIVAWILAFSMGKLGKFYNNIKTFQHWFSMFIAIIFILVGIYYGLVYYEIMS